MAHGFMRAFTRGCGCKLNAPAAAANLTAIEMFRFGCKREKLERKGSGVTELFTIIRNQQK